MASRESTHRAGALKSGGTIAIQVSAAIERDYAKRAVFPELRLQHARRIINKTTGLYEVSTERAKAVLSDAQEQRWSGKHSGGMNFAFTSFIRSIEQSIAEFEEQPAGPTQMPIVTTAAEPPQEPGCFQIGEKALYFRGAEEFGREVRIVEGFSMEAPAWTVQHFAEGNGRRPGYMVQCGGMPFFAAAHELTDLECKPRHLQLVVAS